MTYESETSCTRVGVCGVEARQQTAAAGQLGEGKTLVAVSEVVAAGQQVAGVEIVINLPNQAVDAIVETG